MTSENNMLRQQIEKQLFWLCWIAYLTAYLGRLNYAACLVEISRTEMWSKGEAGLIATGFFATYGCGQLINGMIGDRLHPKWMVACGLGCSGLMNLLFPFAGSAALATVLWCVNGFVQSMIWSPLVRLLSEWLPPEKRQMACVNMNSTVPVGTLAVYGLSAGLVFFGNWRSVFYTSGIVLLIMAAVFYVVVSRLERQSQPMQQAQKAKIEIATERIPLVRLLLTSGIPLICLAAVMQGMLKDGVTAWIPTFLEEEFQLSAASAILSTTVVPLVNLGGVYLASWMNNCFFKNEVRGAVFFFAVGLVALILLPRSSSSAVISLLLLTITTTFMMGINTLLVSMLPPFYVHYGVCSTITGILNSSVYLGSAVSSYLNGIIVEYHGWGSIMRLWCVYAAVGLMLCLLNIKRWCHFRESALLSDKT